MAQLSNITLPNGENYNLKGSNYVVVGTQNSSTGSWTGELTTISALYDGLTIAYYLPWDGNGNATLNLTLKNNNTTGPINCYYQSNIRLTTHYPKGSVIWLTYFSAGSISIDGVDTSDNRWIAQSNYNSDNDIIGYKIRANSGTLVAADTFVRYRLLFTSANRTKWVPATTSTSINATSLREVNQRAIDPFGPIVYYSSILEVPASSWVNSLLIWQQCSVTLGYSFNRTDAALTMTYPAPVYIKCIPQADGSAIIDSTTPFVQQLPSTQDGKIYIYLGLAYNATDVELRLEHPVYYHNGTGIREWTGADFFEKNSHSFQLADKEGNVYFHVNDLKDDDDYATISQTFTGDGTNDTFVVYLRARNRQTTTATVDGVAITVNSITNSGLVDGGCQVELVSVPQEGSEVVITYQTNDFPEKTYTFGTRENGKDIGPLSIVEGYECVSSGWNSHANGSYTKALGSNAFATGYGTIASGIDSSAEGAGSIATGNTAHAEGFETNAPGDSSHAEGIYTNANGQAGHAEGYNTTASGEKSHAEGSNTTASAVASHAEGYHTVAKGSGGCSHAEGYGTTASGGTSHAEGYNTKASGAAAHAEGYITTASGDYSHSGGEGTIAASNYQTAIGKYNIEDNNNGYNFIIGNGTATNARSNALTVDWLGNLWTAAKLTATGALEGASAAITGAITAASATLTGALSAERAYFTEDTFVKSTGIAANTTYDSAVTGKGIVFRNNSNNNLGVVRLACGAGSDRKRGVAIVAANEAASDVYNSIGLYVDKDGNRSVALNQAAWLDALGLSVSETTMTVNTTNTTSIGTNKVRRSGKVVTIYFGDLKIKSALASGTASGTLATVPSGYRPAYYVYSAAFRGANIGSSYWRIDTDGALTLRNHSGSSFAASTTFNGTITYVI